MTSDTVVPSRAALVCAAHQSVSSTRMLRSVVPRAISDTDPAVVNTVGLDALPAQVRHGVLVRVGVAAVEDLDVAVLAPAYGFVVAHTQSVYTHGRGCKS